MKYTTGKIPTPRCVSSRTETFEDYGLCLLVRGDTNQGVDEPRRKIRQADKYQSKIAKLILLGSIK